MTEERITTTTVPPDDLITRGVKHVQHQGNEVNRIEASKAKAGLNTQPKDK